MWHITSACPIPAINNTHVHFKKTMTSSRPEEYHLCSGIFCIFCLSRSVIIHMLIVGFMCCIPYKPFPPSCKHSCQKLSDNSLENSVIPGVVVQCYSKWISFSHSQLADFSLLGTVRRSFACFFTSFHISCVSVLI